MKKQISYLLLAGLSIIGFSTVAVYAQEESDPKQEANDALPTASKKQLKKAWLTSLDEGIKKAKKEGKPVLVEFTGSDWCAPCIMMQEKVFSKAAFIEQVGNSFILVKLDAPKEDEEVRNKNEPYFKNYKIEAMPTVVLLDVNGKEFSRFGASEFTTVESFIEKLALSLRRKGMF